MYYNTMNMCDELVDVNGFVSCEGEYLCVCSCGCETEGTCTLLAIQLMSIIDSRKVRAYCRQPMLLKFTGCLCALGGGTGAQ